MAKLNRESKLHEKRVQKQARKAARKLTEATDAAEASARATMGLSPQRTHLMQASPTAQARSRVSPSE